MKTLEWRSGGLQQGTCDCDVPVGATGLLQMQMCNTEGVGLECDFRPAWCLVLWCEHVALHL
jgi:hypothetical protein